MRDWFMRLLGRFVDRWRKELEEKYFFSEKQIAQCERENRDSHNRLNDASRVGGSSTLRVAIHSNHDVIAYHISEKSLIERKLGYRPVKKVPER